MKRIVMLALAAAVACSLSTVVLAHHGGAAFDQSQTLTFKGTVTEMTFTNPHILIYWDVTKDGATEKWSGWLTAPTKLARAGWTKTTLKPGDVIEVSGTPHKAGNHILQIRKLIAPGGKELPLFEN
jgi:Family of unknown function (DUF6152)